MTADEIMALVRQYGLACNYGQSPQKRQTKQNEIESAIQQLCDERDQIWRNYEENCPVVSAQASVHNLRTDRDSLAARVERLEEAVGKSWSIRYRDKADLLMVRCIHCNEFYPAIETPFEHAPDCIIRTIKQ